MLLVISSGVFSWGFVPCSGYTLLCYCHVPLCAHPAGERLSPAGLVPKRRQLCLAALQ